MPSRDRVPAHLRQFVVDQDYSAYDEIDQAVWRFVLLQTYARLKETAHPAYVDGLAQAGISVERIPRIEEMDASLSRFGWGAVVVDGFIPPRAFQEFQAHGIMTIAAAIRRRKHLAYTPAPDIIHESAGHAPIVPDPTYREFLRRFGEIGARTFASREDNEVYLAIRHLSEVKEDRDSTPRIIEAAEQRLERAQANVTWTTEAALLSRLHWWTVEYGLVGTLDDPKIYGAGLLSSLGESTSCLKPHVEKRPLSVACVEQDYDITRPQPHLYVAEDFDQLNAVLDEFADTLAQRRGGREALEMMHRAAELGTVEFTSGAQITGVLDEIVMADDAPAYLRFSGECALSLDGRTLPEQEREDHAAGYGAPFGRLDDGRALGEMTAEDFEALADGDRRLRLRYASGVEVEGTLARTQSDEAGRLRTFTLTEAHARLGDRVLFAPDWGVYDVAVGEEVKSCFAGPADPSYHPATEFPRKKVPEPKDNETAAEEAAVLDYYRRALAFWEAPENPDLVEGFRAIERDLEGHPDEWLLRWNLLECLRKVDKDPGLRDKLRDDLLAIEKTDPDALPISTGLRYLESVG